MDGDDLFESICVTLDGRNYSYWSCVMKFFLKGKRMWGYISGELLRPTKDDSENYADFLSVWDLNNSKIITWINNSIEYSIRAQLTKYGTAQEVWDHLRRLYTQPNLAKQYQIESDIRAIGKKNLSILELYSAMTNLWNELALMEPTELQTFQPYVNHREEQRLVQFLMALCNDFNGLRSSILHRNPVPSVDSVVHELLTREIYLQSCSLKSPAENVSVMQLSSRSTFDFQ